MGPRVATLRISKSRVPWGRSDLDGFMGETFDFYIYHYTCRSSRYSPVRFSGDDFGITLLNRPWSTPPLRAREVRLWELRGPAPSGLSATWTKLGCGGFAKPFP